MTDLIPTPEQQSIITQARLGGNIECQALAGTAKSTTSEMVAKAIPPLPALALAFNVKTKQETEKRFPGFFLVQTMNGLGHRAWGQALGRRIQVEPEKLGKLVTQTMKEAGYRGTTESWTNIRSLVSAAQTYGLVPDSDPHHNQTLIPDSPEGWQELCEQTWNQSSPLERDLARSVLVQSIASARGQNGPPTVTYDEQIYCSALLGGLFPRFPLVMLDEAQDLSTLNHIQVAKCSADRLFVAGDQRQSLYAFRGADHESLANLRHLRPAWHQLPLHTTFRCPKVVVARQQAHAPGFTAAPANPEGEFLVWRAWDQTMLPPGAAILCRNNAPLLSVAFKFLRRRVGVTMLGRDIGKGLTSLAKKICPNLDASVVDFVVRVNEWATRETELALANKKESRLEGIEDRASSLIAVAEGSEATSVRGVLAELEDLFQGQGQITLGSIHRSKGLEWNFVLHLDPWRVPSKFALAQAQAGDNRALIQEHNARYVAETRTRHTLVEANLEDFQ